MDKLRLSMNARHVAAVAAAATGIVLFFLPAPERPLGTQNSAEVAAAPAHQTAPAVTVEEFKPLFDLAGLPRPPAPEPPPAAPIDPRAAIGRYMLLGVTVNDNEALALIADGGRQLTLRQGDVLAGFTVTQIRPRQVDFEKEGIAASLRLAETTRRTSNDLR